MASSSTNNWHHYACTPHACSGCSADAMNGLTSAAEQGDELAPGSHKKWRNRIYYCRRRPPVRMSLTLPS
jgi:hypothetical protein